MRPVTVTVGPLVAASANNIALTQTPTSAVTLNGTLVTGGVAVLDTPRRILITTTGNESAKTFTIVGTDVNGQTQTELLTGVTSGGTGYSNVDFKTVTSITMSAAAAAALTVGTNTIASSAWVRLDDYAPAPVAIQSVVTGTVSFNIETTMQDPNSFTNAVLPYQVVWNQAVSSVISTTSTNLAVAPAFVRFTLTSGTGSVSNIVTQLSKVPY